MKNKEFESVVNFSEVHLKMKLTLSLEIRKYYQPLLCWCLMHKNQLKPSCIEVSTGKRKTSFDESQTFLQNPQERLGCHPQSGFSDIQSNNFFKTINWEQLYSKQIIPPYKPQVNSEMDLDHFDPQFTNEPVQLTPDDM